MHILILHANGGIEATRRTSLNHSFCLLKYAPQHSYTFHTFRQPVTERLRSTKFDVIILDTTFLCWRWAKPRKLWLDRILEQFSFIGASDAVKIAFPQDEYDHSEYLDEWLAAWNVDLIYSVCFDHREIFYKRAALRAEIVQGLTGYVDDADMALMSRTARPFTQREIDVGYRARKLPAFFGRFGQMKALIGERFREKMDGRGLHLDISTRESDMLSGDAWLHFLGNSKFTLGCESGSSLLDGRGEIRSCVETALAIDPSASFEKLEKSCFPAQDMVRIYSAISPRLFEAAIARSCQILVPSHYMGVLKAGDHYIPLAEDMSNVDAVLQEMRDEGANRARIEACYEALIGSPRFHYRHFTADILRRVEEISIRKNLWNAAKRHSEEQLVAPKNDAELRHAFLIAAFRSHQHHVDDLKEINFIPNLRHYATALLGRALNALGRRLRAYRSRN
jgi:hypothetical protein